MRLRSFRSHGLRNGFTLLEVILAAALGSVILAGLFQAVHLNWKYRTSSEQANAENRMAFALIEDIALDVRATLPPVSKPERKESSEQMLQLPQTDFSERFLSIETSTLLEPLNFVGTSEALLIFRSGTNPRFDPATGESRPVEQVAWWGASSRSIRLPYAKSGTQMKHKTLESPRNGAGLFRATYPIRNKPGADRENPQSVSSHVSKIRFRYFDGQKWRDNWNSENAQRLPVAVEVTVEIASGSLASIRSVVSFPQSSNDMGPAT